MGGNILKLASDKLREEALARGRAEGRAEGKDEGISALASAIQDLRAGMSKKELRSKYGERVAEQAIVCS